MTKLLIAAFILVHMADKPELDSWFNGLTSKNGWPCCSEVDSKTVADVDWDTTIIDGKPHYRVHIEGRWIAVTDEEVVQGPNRYHRAIVWIYHINGKPMVRCFMPGAEI